MLSIFNPDFELLDLIVDPLNQIGAVLSLYKVRTLSKRTKNIRCDYEEDHLFILGFSKFIAKSIGRGRHRANRANRA